MKKLALTILAVFYLGISSGAPVHLHYCMGQLVEWGLGSKSDEDCSKCGMKTAKSKDCCKNEHKQLKFQSDQKLSQNVFQLKIPATDLGFQAFQSQKEYYVLALFAEYPVSNSPPKVPDTPAFVRNCVFRI